jgi:hypothetical protein
VAALQIGRGGDYEVSISVAAFREGCYVMLCFIKDGYVWPVCLSLYLNTPVLAKCLSIWRGGTKRGETIINNRSQTCFVSPQGTQA